MAHLFLQKIPFDLYELSLFQLVVREGNFTKAARAAGLTQSAMTRQVQGMEQSLEIQLLERTTRNVTPTAAGWFLFEEASRILGDVEHSLEQMAQQFSGARKTIRLDVSRTVGLSYLPGFLHANRKRFPDLICKVSCHAGGEVLQAVESSEQDVGILCPPKKLPATLQVVHRFSDTFTLIAPRDLVIPPATRPKQSGRIISFLAHQPWLLLEDQSNTGSQLRLWMKRHGLAVEPVMQLDNFDLIISLVELGMGVSLVPMRALALYNHRRRLQRIPLPDPFTRQLVGIVRRRRKQPDHLKQFVENILF